MCIDTNVTTKWFYRRQDFCIVTNKQTQQWLRRKQTQIFNWILYLIAFDRICWVVCDPWWCALSYCRDNYVLFYAVFVAHTFSLHTAKCRYSVHIFAILWRQTNGEVDISALPIYKHFKFHWSVMKKKRSLCVDSQLRQHIPTFSSSSQEFLAMSGSRSSARVHGLKNPSALHGAFSENQPMNWCSTVALLLATAQRTGCE